MSHSYSCVFVHIVFSTKNRMSYFQNPDLRSGLHAYLGGLARKKNCIPVAIGGYVDHVHALLTMHNAISVGEVVKDMKRLSTLWVREQVCNSGKFTWQEGFSAFSVSDSVVPRVVRYIRNQEEHHRALSFEEEMRAILDKSSSPRCAEGATGG